LLAAARPDANIVRAAAMAKRLFSPFLIMAAPRLQAAPRRSELGVDATGG
jgi:hypothetical protein